MRNKSEQVAGTSAVARVIICPGCKRERPQLLREMDNAARRRLYRDLLGSYQCCNPDCRGQWGTGCYHCHHPDHRRSNPANSIVMMTHERHATLLAAEALAEEVLLDQPLACMGCDAMREERDAARVERNAARGAAQSIRYESGFPNWTFPWEL